jgi:hypothetical protein
VTWELTRKQAGGDFFAAHTVAELAGWSDYDLEDAGRLSEPMRYDAASDRYVPVSWEKAFGVHGICPAAIVHSGGLSLPGFRWPVPAGQR